MSYNRINKTFDCIIKSYYGYDYDKTKGDCEYYSSNIDLILKNIPNCKYSKISDLREYINVYIKSNIPDIKLGTKFEFDIDQHDNQGIWITRISNFYVTVK